MGGISTTGLYDLDIMLGDASMSIQQQIGVMSGSYQFINFVYNGSELVWATNSDYGVIVDVWGIIT